MNTIMRNVRLCIGGALLAAAVTACSGDDRDPGPITVAPAIAQPRSSTRVAEEGYSMWFTEGDQVAIYAWTGVPGYIDRTQMVVDGVTNTLGKDSLWHSSPQMRWADMVSNHYFFGIYPARKVTDFEHEPFKLTGDYATDDLLVGMNNTGIKATGEPVGIVFDHMMARLQVSLTFKNQWDTTPAGVTVSCLAVDACEVDLVYRRYIPTDGQKTLALMAMASSTDKEQRRSYQDFRGIMIPQQGFREITVSVGDKTFVYTHPQDIPLQQGRVTIVNLTLGRDVIELGGITIDEWTEGDTFYVHGYRQ